MSELVDPRDIERIVGVERDIARHYARAVSLEQKVYILHSQTCVTFQHDLRDCAFSKALDHGLQLAVWAGYENKAVPVVIRNGRLVPKPIHRADG
jgi:hypothetical protein